MLKKGEKGLICLLVQIFAVLEQARKQRSKDGQGTDPDTQFRVLVEHESGKQDASLA